MNKVKNQHYVPQNYLMNFTDKEGLLYAYDKTTQKEPFHTSPRNVASGRYFYDIHPDVLEPDKVPADFNEQIVEHTLSGLEGMLKNQIDCIIARYTMSADPLYKEAISLPERTEFAVQVAIQYLRTADFRNQAIELSKTIHQTMIDLIGVNEIVGYKPGDVRTELDPKYETVEHLRYMADEKFLKEITRGIHQNFIWVVGINRTDQPFFTSDNPVVKHGHLDDDGIISHQGILSPGMEIVYPLTSKLILILYERRYFDYLNDNENKFMPIDNPDNVTYYNSLQVLQSSKQIYCKEPKFELIQLMATEMPDIMKKREHSTEVDAPLLQRERKRKKRR